CLIYKSIRWPQDTARPSKKTLLGNTHCYRKVRLIGSGAQLLLDLIPELVPSAIEDHVVMRSQNKIATNVSLDVRNDICVVDLANYVSIQSRHFALSSWTRLTSSLHPDPSCRPYGKRFSVLQFLLTSI